MWSNFLKLFSFCWSHWLTRFSVDASSTVSFSCWIPKELMSLFSLPFSSTVWRLSLWFMYFVESWSEFGCDTRNDALVTPVVDLDVESFVFSHLSLMYFMMSVTLARSSSLWSKSRRKALRKRGVNFLKLSGILVVSRFCNYHQIKIC